MNEIIITKPEFYFYTQNKSLEQRLEDIKLNDEKVDAIIYSKTINTIRDKALGLFRLGDIVKTIINWNEEVDEDI